MFVLVIDLLSHSQSTDDGDDTHDTQGVASRRQCGQSR